MGQLIDMVALNSPLPRGGVIVSPGGVFKATANDVEYLELNDLAVRTGAPSAAVSAIKAIEQSANALTDIATATERFIAWRSLII